jgi:hypothetical protein
MSGGGPSAAAAVDGEDWELEGVPDDYVCLQRDLWDELLLMHGDAADIQHQQQLLKGGTSSADMPGRGAAPKDAGGGMQGAFSTAVVGGKDAAAADCIAGLQVPEASSATTVGADEVVGGSVHGGFNGSGSQFEAKITALMAEWGFTDRATAEAYYK